MKLRKILVVGILTIATAGIVGYYVMKPSEIFVALAEYKDIALYFTEEGFVKDENLVSVYSLHSGGIVSQSAYVNQIISKGDIICEIDSTLFKNEIEIEKGIVRGLLSQISNLDMQELQKKDELMISRNELMGEYQSTLVEEKNDSQSLSNAEVLKDAQIRLQEMIIEQNEANLLEAREDLNKYEQLFDSGALTKQELDDKYAAVSRLESTQSQSMQQLEIIKDSNEPLSKSTYYNSLRNSILEQVDEIDRQLENSYNDAMKDYYFNQIVISENKMELLKKQIDECVVRAPVTGYINEINIGKSNVVGTDSPVAIISTGYDCLVEVYVPTSEIMQVKINDIVDLELKSAVDEVFQGIVTNIEDKAVVTVSSLGVEKRKVKVTIKPQTEYEKYFKPGHDLNVRFTSFSTENKLTIPRTAVARIDDKDSAWVIVDGKAELRHIEIEQELKVEYVVSSGIAEGEYVVIDATNKGLAEGANFIALGS